jgi:hypothetical protein
LLEYIPPREQRQVTIDGFEVPLIEAREADNGTTCHISLDNRFGIILPATCAAEVLWLVANAMAIGAGYSCHGENSRPVNPYKVRVSAIGSVTDRDGVEHPVGDA